MIIPFAGVVKQCVEMITGVDMDEREPDGSYDYSRRLKSKKLSGGKSIGVFIRDFAESVREIDEMVWINATFNSIESSNRMYYVIPDMRMLQEYTYLYNLDKNSEDYTVFMFRIKADPKLQSLADADGRTDDHPTETGLLNVCVDGEFVNTRGSSSPKQIAESIVKTISMYR